MNNTAYAMTVRGLNDTFRTTLCGGRVLVTAGVRELGSSFARRALAAVQGFSDFEEPNDPYREHDLGSFELDHEQLFFKIDTYDLSLARHSPDATNPNVTVRVLTVMLAEEY